MRRRSIPDRASTRFGLMVVAMSLAFPASLHSQGISAATIGLSTRSQSTGIASKLLSVPAAVDRTADPLRVTLASAILPGSGQIMMRQRRSVAYLAIEAAALTFYVSQTRDGRRQRDRYRKISRDVARADFNPNGPRGDWDYYERMEKFIASGDFDENAGEALDPETDEETFNGSVWLLARQTYWRDPEVSPDPSSPEFSAAMKFYESRAVPHDMRWSWIGDAEAYQQFRSAISGSNSAFRSAGHTASIVLANHFLSAVDAYVSAQIRLRRNADRSIATIVSVPFRY